MDKFRVSVKAFIVDEGKLLILKRAEDDIQLPSIWEISGGRLDLGEDPSEGLKREVKEETGLSISPICPFGCHHFTRTDGQIITLLVYLCKKTSGTVKLSHEHSEYEWRPVVNCKGKLTAFYDSDVDMFLKLGLETLLSHDDS